MTDKSLKLDTFVYSTEIKIMTISNNLKGILFAIAATLSFSNVYIFSKMAMKNINLASFGLLWFGLALIYNLIYYYFFTERKKFFSLPSKSKLNLLLIGFSELISISAFFLSIKHTTNPVIVSFLANTSPIFVILIGFVFLRIRYKAMALIGVFVSLSGVLIMNFSQSNFNFKLLLDTGSISALIFAVFYALSLVLAKNQIKNIPTTMITVCRTLFLFLGFLFYNLILFEMPNYTANSLFYIGVGSIFGPFLGILLTFVSLKYVDASITTLIGTSRSIFIIGASYLFLNILPNQNQLLGGILTILGILLITFNDMRIKKQF